ncbi:MAG: hypothetical protein AAFR81_16505 [Chloroflexota bacterium]
MNEIRARIERIRRINEAYMYLELATDDERLAKIKPGSSLLARRIDPDDDAIEHWDPYLRDQWYPAGFTKAGNLLIEMRFSYRYRPGMHYSVLGPIGKPYRFRKSLRNVLLVADDAPPLPLTIMIQQLLHNKISVTLVLLGEAQKYKTDHLAPEVEVIRGTGTLQWTDQVMTLGWADQIFVVVNQDDELLRFARFYEKVEQLRTQVPQNYIFGVFQMPMPCGVGACGACMMRFDKEIVPACTQGPTFDLTRVQLPKLG